MPKKPLAWAIGAVIVLAIAIYTASQVSPWPSSLTYRLYRLTMPRVAARLNERYDTNDPDAVLDVYYPSEVENTDRSLPTIVWVHGGGFYIRQQGRGRPLSDNSGREKLHGRRRQLLAGAGQDLSDADPTSECGSRFSWEECGRTAC